MSAARLGSVRVGGGEPVAVIGVINLSPDSFYAGSVVRGLSAIRKRAREMVEQGASMIDVGAMGTGPKSKPVPAEKEMRELIPAIKLLAADLDVPLSADTQRAEVAEAAIEAGATVINDISGLKTDSRMAEVIARAGCSALLMAAEHAPGDVYEISEIRRALRKSLDICRNHGIPLNRVVIDPAVGFWPARLARLGSLAKKRVRERPYSFATFLDLRILAELRELEPLGRPICVGVSRKSFIGEVLGLPRPEHRLTGSLAATAIAVFNGASAIRTHDVRETLQAVRLAEAVREAGGRK
jgi:dihydropteroate synthase